MQYKSTASELMFNHNYRYIGIYTKPAVKQLLLMQRTGHAEIKVYFYQMFPDGTVHYAVYIKPNNG